MSFSIAENGTFVYLLCIELLVYYNVATPMSYLHVILHVSILHATIRSASAFPLTITMC